MNILFLLLFCSAIVASLANEPVISNQEFIDAVTYCGCKPPPDDVYDVFINATHDMSRLEAALFLAQLIHETGSFKFIEENECKKTKCPDRYKDNVGLPGKYYYGRGYVQLTWAKNYKAASEDLGMGDLLLREPELVASDKRIAMLVSRWYWDKHVRPRMKQNPGKFGVTTKAINAPECKNFPDRAKKRWMIFLKVAEKLSLEHDVGESGCYN